MATQPTLAQLIRSRLMSQQMPMPTEDTYPNVPPPSAPLGTNAPNLDEYGALPGGIANRSPQEPPRPRLAQRVIGGFEGQPGGGLAGTLGGMARGALSGALGPTQQPDIEQERLQKLRSGSEMALERQREAYGAPEQQARIGAQQASTQQTQLQSEILKNRIDAMKKMQQPGGAGDPFMELGTLAPDEQAIRDAAYDEFSYTANPSSLMQGVSKIYQQRAVSGRVGPGTTVADPNSATGVSRQFITRGGQAGPRQSGAVVPALTGTETQGQTIQQTPTGTVSIPTTTTKRPIIPGSNPQAGAGQARPVMNAGGGQVQGTSSLTGNMTKDLNSYQKNYQDIHTLLGEQQDILAQAARRGDGYLTGPESNQFLADHMGLTVGRVKGMRTGKDLINMHAMARSWPQDVEAVFSRVIAGGLIPIDQAQQMFSTTQIKEQEARREIDRQASSLGMTAQYNRATGAVRLVPNAAK